MSTHSSASAGPAPAPAPTIEEMEAALIARRERLAVDMEVLGTRLAPEALKTQARDTARATAAWTRTAARIVAGISIASPVMASTSLCCLSGAARGPWVMPG